MSARAWLRWHSVRAHVLAPIWLRLPEKRRWTVVDLLNKSRRQCWCDLVDAALASPEEDACDVHLPTLRGERQPYCASACRVSHDEHAGQHECACYCGKFEFVAAEGYLDRRGQR